MQIVPAKAKMLGGKPIFKHTLKKLRNSFAFPANGSLANIRDQAPDWG